MTYIITDEDFPSLKGKYSPLYSIESEGEGNFIILHECFWDKLLDKQKVREAIDKMIDEEDRDWNALLTLKERLKL